ncbi:sorting nexin-19 isoform X2 [Thamnophis elegans]|uniref:sorting nexin-19 isoform X2 n=1 Tax=Thamnophis elegans TaxID=35005 RepID=UPI001378812A|nr:sorting nexin-19 isoform X2 [Thamnophis elegans]
MLRMPEQGVGLGDLAGSRKLMALGALVGWLLVVHLLVNVWLLCLLSGLLALLGGWLGSQVVVGTSHRIHLERFLTLEGCPPDPKAERELEKEILNIIQKILRDFVSSWYRAVSREQNFEKEVEKAMVGLALELRKRMHLVDKKALTQKVLLLAGCHLQAYKKVQEKWKEEAESLGGPPEEAGRLWQAYCEFSEPHLAVQSPTHQVEYTRRVVDSLLRVLVPEPHLESRTGRFVVVEMVTCNVLMPVMNKMADPDWLNQLLVNLFSRKAAATVEMASPEVLPASSSQPVVPGAVLPPDLQQEMATEGDKALRGDSEPFNRNVVDSLEDFLMEGKEPVDRALSTPVNEKEDGSVAAPLLHPGTLGSFFPSGDLEVDSPMSDAGKDSSSLIVVSAEELFASSLLDLEGPLEVDPEDSLGEKDRCAEDVVEGFPSEANLQAASLGLCPDIHIETVAEDPLVSLTELLADPEKTFLRRPSYLGKELEPPGSLAHSPQYLAQPPSLLSSSPTAPMGTFSFEPLSPDGPVIIQNLRITGTITAREHSGTGFHPYTLYTVKYDTTLDSDSTNSLQQVAYHTVNRRYREFLNLQTRLEEKPDLRKFIKNIKGPKKMFPDLPFGNMDTEKVEARKSLLESFLKHLCAIPEIANSEEMQEFLALNTDARIAFVKKPFVVSRIDKIVMNAIVDTLKTAFPRPEPQSPTEELSETEVDGRQSMDGKKSNKSKLKFTSGKMLNVAGTPEKILYSFRDGVNASEVLSLARMESFIQNQEKLLEAMTSEGPEREGDEEPPSDLNPKPAEVLQQTAEEDTNSGPETSLADVVLDLLCLIMVDQWSWLWSENMQKFLHLLFGTLIQRLALKISLPKRS